MKMQLLAFLFLLIFFGNKEVHAREKFIDNKYICEKQKGIWREFGNDCANNCNAQNDAINICGSIAIYGCDCGIKKCWDNIYEQCLYVQKYEERLKEEFDAKIKEEKRISDEKIAREKKIIDDKIAEDKRIADEKRIEEQKKLDEKKAEDEKKKLEEDKKIEDQKKEEINKKSEENKKSDDLKKDVIKEIINNAAPPISGSTNPVNNSDIKVRDIKDVMRDLDGSIEQLPKNN